MRSLLGFLIFGFLFVSCQMEPETPIVRPQKFDQKAYVQQLKKERDSLKLVQKEIEIPPESTNTVQTSDPIEFAETTDTVQVEILYGKAKVDTLKVPRQKMIFVLDSDTANELKLKISPQDSTANLEISEIIDPKGISVKPSKTEIDLPINEKGLYKIIVSENPTRGKDWGGRFLFEVKLGW